MKRTLLLVAAVSLTTSATFAGAAGDADAGKEKAQVCASCHGPDGKSATGQFPTLAGQYASYLLKALEDYASGARENAVMAGFAKTLSAEDRQDLAAFYAAQEGLSVVCH